MNWWRQWKKQRRCFHHDIGGNPANSRVAVSWILQVHIDTGMRKLFECDESMGGCGKVWIT